MRGSPREASTRADPTDLLVAAVAEVGEAILLHYDRHFDQVASVAPTDGVAARRGTIP